MEIENIVQTTLINKITEEKQMKKKIINMDNLFKIIKGNQQYYNIKSNKNDKTDKCQQ